jgi:hypothetical protein
MNRKQTILTLLAAIALLLVVADYHSAKVWKLFGLIEIDKSSPDVSWHIFEGVILVVCYFGLLYLLRSKPHRKENG